MWDALFRPIHDHLPLWLLLLPLLGAMVVSVAKRAGPKAVRRTMQLHSFLSATLCVWLVVAYEPLKPVNSVEEAALLGPLQRFQFRDSFEWVGETRTALLDHTRTTEIGRPSRSQFVGGRTSAAKWAWMASASGSSL